MTGRMDAWGDNLLDNKLMDGQGDGAWMEDR